MIRLKHTCYSLVLLLFSCLLFSSTLYASEIKVFDYANLLDLDEITTLEEDIATLSETYQIDIGIVTTDDVGDQSSSSYAEDFYLDNEFGLGSDLTGVLLLINMDDREVWISTSGECIRLFTDYRINSMVESVINQLGDDAYFKGCTTFLAQVEAYAQSGIPDNQYTVNTEKPNDLIDYREDLTLSQILLRILIALLIALGGASAICFGVRYRYKNPKHYITPTIPDRSSVNFTDKKDQFTHTHTSRVKIQRDPPATGGGDSGQSSSHSSSSGHSFGGGGGKF